MFLFDFLSFAYILIQKNEGVILMKKIMMIALFLVGLLYGCTTIEEGVVLEKYVEEEATTVLLLPTPVTTGKITTTILTPMTQYYPESYVLKVEGLDKNGKLVTETLYVSKSEFDQYDLGDTYVVSAHDTTERSYEERKATDEEEKKYLK